MEDGLAHRLAGDGAGIDADSPHHGLALDHGDALVELGALNRGALSGRARADHQDVVVVLRHVAAPSPVAVALAGSIALAVAVALAYALCEPCASTRPGGSPRPSRTWCYEGRFSKHQQKAPPGRRQITCLG